LSRILTILLPLIGALVLAGLPTDTTKAQPWRHGGQVVIPDSSIERAEQIGFSAHTNLKIWVPADVSPTGHAANPQQGPPFSGYFYETPASLACVYNLVSPVSAGCNPNTVTTNPSGGAHAIAIVDAYHYPTALNDLGVFSAQFGLPLPTASNFQVVYANGRQPAVNADWNIEEALDVEWAHAMAPQAKIYLVEAASNSFSNLLAAVSVASNLIRQAGGGEVSMSWGGSEFSGETSDDSYFSAVAGPGVVYFAAAGDSPGVIWPSASPNVVSAGGTAISRNLSTGAFQQELVWQSTGGGPSQYEAIPSYQHAVVAIVQGYRGTPDVAADADPSSGVWVFDYPYWYIVGGTSVAAPVWAGIVNAAAGFAAGSATELTTIYKNLGSADFRTIIQGSCGPNEAYLAGPGWDFCTGVGSPLGLAGK
jgi:kumamolisin